MIKIIAGRYGPGLLGPGTILNLDDATEQRMVDRKVAEYIDNSDLGTTSQNNNALILKTDDMIKKIKAKKDLIIYAESIGLHGLEEALSKDALVDAIINYQEETFGKE